MLKITIRKATVEDADLLLRFIYELAKVDKTEHEVEANKSQIIKTIFEKDATTHAIIGESEGCPLGHAIYFFNYSTCQGKNGVYIEDLYISPEYRNIGVGKEIIKYLSCLGLEKDCGMVEWSVLDWNTSAIGFYESMGAKSQDELIRYRLTGNTLKQVAYS